MTIRRIFAILVVGLVSASSLTACSMLGFDRPSRGTIEVKQAVLNVASDYLRFVVANKTRLAEGMILWGDYSDNKGLGFSRELWQRQLEYLHTTFDPGDVAAHPLVNLDLVNIDVDDSNSVVVLRKYNNPQAPEVRIALTWVGKGWLVTDDSLFGSSGLIAQLAAARQGAR
ncbi:MAG: hypothetical protein KDD44_01550 [Bdellovibrionales bacterium]|nr:hypothetical protein [Bdellovibrionales bacterium]